MRARLIGLLAITAVASSACGGSGFGTAKNTVAFIPGYRPGGSTPMPASSPVTGVERHVVMVHLGDTDAQHMYIRLSQTVAPTGRIAFIVTNDSTDMKHELVGFATKTPAGAYPIAGFEGDPNRIDEDAAGPAVIDSGAALAPGASKVLTADLAPGHYALVCNLPGHYKAGMHVDFWVTAKG
jgi:uncharacterized cupredoxin-like copper-binding protein